MFELYFRNQHKVIGILVIKDFTKSFWNIIGEGRTMKSVKFLVKTYTLVDFIITNPCFRRRRSPFFFFFSDLR